jgi:hypothetical protein
MCIGIWSMQIQILGVVVNEMFHLLWRRHRRCWCEFERAILELVCWHTVVRNSTRSETTFAIWWPEIALGSASRLLLDDDDVVKPP